MFTSEALMNGPFPDVKVGIGCAPDSKYVETSVRAMNNPNIVIYRDPEKLAKDLADGTIAAAVRGDMSASKLLPLVRTALGLPVLERLVIMEHRNKIIFSAPVGIDEGWTVDQKVDMAVRSVALMKKLGVNPIRIAVMSGGRCEDYGRNQVVDQTIRDAREVVKQLTARGYDAYHSQILIEDAVEQADLIIAPDGIAGNLIFRVMHFIGGEPALGAPLINAGKVFVDTSRVKTDFTDSLALALKLTEVE
ncbi:MAG: methanogenesis marker protein Mmp4/MtxX [Candidatus Methanomethylophilus sp.]|nr:methanogenesis marker protein Mmp4/MtxX [Methanomethylophilus sp.]MDD3233362.1 methanogenesis marker protein Mmp4/MtxX [Methanomethylophilus sp.]MDD4221697.1 methanogenesis marker protein Mmp4/MtxX [Methanomethylophilus sp.]MDD4668269.1 methanogenesis marker protein Mmp4/MtxX [Methanomethylophilus sp.]